MLSEQMLKDLDDGKILGPFVGGVWRTSIPQQFYLAQCLFHIREIVSEYHYIVEPITSGHLYAIRRDLSDHTATTYEWTIQRHEL